MKGSVQMDIRFSDDVVSELKALYRAYGYTLYKMNRFEEYDLYSANRDFLRGDNLITFNNSHGRLMALKPDVTLSIVKNAPSDGSLKKVYYSENVYRAPRGSGEICEIPQIGLECLGDIDAYRVYEMILLAARSLSMINADYVLDISHMGYLSALLDAADVTDEGRRELTALLSAKNPHDILELGVKLGLDKAISDRLAALATISGAFSRETINKLSTIAYGIDGTKEALEELELLLEMFSVTDIIKHLSVDFSVVNDMKYYNGIVFAGYLRGVPSPVLSGGRYDELPKKFGKACGAIGFAVDLGLIQQFSVKIQDYDADVLITYSPDTDPALVAATAEKVRNDGKTVYVISGNGNGVTAGEIIKLNKEA